jgi:hypothetical protein
VQPGVTKSTDSLGSLHLCYAERFSRPNFFF